MPLTQPQKRFLRSKAHQLRPVVMLGQHGVTENVIAELEGALDAHELVKVRISGAEREARHEAIEVLLQRTGAELVQSIGHIAVLFRRNRDRPKVVLPA